MSSPVEAVTATVLRDLQDEIFVSLRAAEELLELHPAGSAGHTAASRAWGGAVQATSLSHRLASLLSALGTDTSPHDANAVLGEVALGLGVSSGPESPVRAWPCGEPAWTRLGSRDLGDALLGLGRLCQSRHGPGTAIEIAAGVVEACDLDGAMSLDAPPTVLVTISVGPDGDGADVPPPAKLRLALTGVEPAVREARSLVEAAGGSLVMQDSSGTAFSLLLPWTPPILDAGRPRTAAVLVVQGDLVEQRRTCRMLRAAGFDVVEAGDAVEAVSLMKLQSEQFGAVVADVVLREGSGHLVALTARDQFGVPTLLLAGPNEWSAAADDAASASMRLLRRPANATDMVAEVTLLVARGGLAAD